MESLPPPPEQEVIPPEKRLLQVGWFSVPGKVVRLVQSGAILVLLSWAGWSLQNFFSLRGVMNVLASRINLAFFALLCFIAVSLLTITFPRKSLWRGLAAVTLILGVIALDWWAPKPGTAAVQSQVAVACKITAQRSMPKIQPTPDRASDQQLLRASLAAQISLLNLLTVDLNASMKARHEKMEDKPDDRLCPILQEYETNLRIPAQIVQQTFFNRVPPEEKVLSEAKDIRAAYEHPQSIKALEVVMNDLSRLDKSLEKVKRIEEEDDSKNDWIITPLPHFTAREPRNETDFNLVQEYPAKGYVAKLMDMEFSVGAQPSYRSASGSILVALAREVDWDRAHRVRIIFDAPIREWMLSHSEGEYQLGNDFIEFITDEWKQTESAQFEIRGHIRIKRLVVMQPS